MMRYAPTALYLLAVATTPAWAVARPRDFFFFVTPVVPTTTTVPTPAPVPPTNAPVVPRAGVPAVPAAVDTDRVASALGSCVRCHSAPNPKGKTTLFDAAGTFAPAVAPAAVYAAVADDSMPLSGPKLSRADKDLIRRWAGVTQ